MKLILTSLAVIVSLVLSGCSNQQAKPFELKNLAKSEIDMVTDSHMQEAEKQAKQLLIKLYKRNPRELRKAAAGTSIETRIEQLFKHPRQVQFNELGKAYGISAIPLAFDENYKGDRVFALMAGVAGIAARLLQLSRRVLSARRPRSAKALSLSAQYGDGSLDAQHPARQPR